MFDRSSGCLEICSEDNTAIAAQPQECTSVLGASVMQIMGVINCCVIECYRNTLIKADFLRFARL